MRGNMLDMAVGIVMGVAFCLIVNSLVQGYMTADMTSRKSKVLPKR